MATVRERKGRTVAVVAGACALIVGLLATVQVGRGRKWFGDAMGVQGRVLLSRTSGFQPPRVDVSAGSIAAVEFIRFLADYTGLPVLYDTNDVRVTKMQIQLAADLQDVDAEVIRSLLEANGLSVEVETMNNGKDAIRITPKKP